MRNPFRYFNSSPEVIRLAVMMYVRFPLAPILTSFSRSVVTDQCSASFDTADFSFGSKADSQRRPWKRPLLGEEQT